MPVVSLSDETAPLTAFAAPETTLPIVPLTASVALAAMPEFFRVVAVFFVPAPRFFPALFLLVEGDPDVFLEVAFLAPPFFADVPELVSFLAIFLVGICSSPWVAHCNA